MRLLHLADVHLDTPSPGRSELVRQRLRSASRDALRRAVDLALAEQVHAVVIAGDLFDGSRLSFDTERFLLAEMGRLAEAGIPAIYATGNHDAPELGSRAFELPWPESLTVVARAEPVRVEISAPDGTPVGAVTAIGHPTSHETRDLSDLLPPPPQQRLPEVAVLHTQVRRAESSDRHHPYAPTTLEALLRTGYHCWALGHVHRRQVLHTGPLISYCGNPQGRTFNETGPRGVQLLDLTDPRAPKVSFHETARLRFETLPVDALDQCHSLDALVRTVEASWRHRLDSEGSGADEWIVRVELSGPCPLSRELAEADDLRVLEDELAGRLGALAVEVWSSTHPVLRVEDHLDRDDVLGEALRLIANLEAGKESLSRVDPGELAGCDEPAGARRDDYLRSLLMDAGPGLVALLRIPDPETGA
ncbi:MAG: DNA repair exonuclease [Gemmatimonadota bacterium]